MDREPLFIEQVPTQLNFGLVDTVICPLHGRVNLPGEVKIIIVATFRFCDEATLPKKKKSNACQCKRAPDRQATTKQTKNCISVKLHGPFLGRPI